MPKTSDRTQIMKDMGGYMKPKEVEKLIELSKELGKGERNRILLKTLWETGARVSEIVGKKICKNCGKQIAWNPEYPSTPHCECSREENDYKHYWPLVRSRILVDEGTLILHTLKKNQKDNPPPDPKDRKEPPQRRVDVTDGLIDDLIGYVKEKNIAGNERIFSITKERVFQIVKKAAELEDVETVSGETPSPHVFRHSHAIRYISADNSVEGLKKLRDRFQHASINTTTFYLQFDRSGEKEKIEKLFGGEK